MGKDEYLCDPQPGGPVRCETQALAHRAALLGADCSTPWADQAGTGSGNGRRRCGPRSGRTSGSTIREGVGPPPPGPRTVARCPTWERAPSTSWTPGLLSGGEYAPGLLDKVQTEQLARLLGSPVMDSGWGLRGLGAKEVGHNPFGHRGGAVRVHETAIGVSGLAAAGYEKEAGSLLRGVLAAAEAFGHRLPEMYGGEQRTEGSAPLPHPAACRPAATAAAAGVLLLTTLAGIRPDAPAGTVTLRPLRSAPLGELGLTGLRLSGARLLRTGQPTRTGHGRGSGRRAAIGHVTWDDRGLADSLGEW